MKTVEPTKSDKKVTNEKPVSLAGPKFKDVLKALLETKPMSKGKEENNDQT